MGEREGATEGRERPDGSRPARALVIGLWFGVALACARGTVVFGMDRMVRGHELETALSRIDGKLALLVPLALAVGVVSVLLANRLGAAKAYFPVVILVFVVVSGAGWDDRFHVPDPETRRGLQALALLATGALVAAVVLMAVLHRAPRVVGSVASGVVALAVLVGGRALFASVSGPGRTMVRREVVHELPREPGRWRVVEENGLTAAAATVITPSVDWKVDGGDLPALLMTPPCAIEFEVDDELTFVAAAGVDGSIDRFFVEGPARVAFRFRARIDGAIVFDERVEVGRGEDASRAWRRLGGGSGIDVPAGSVVRLETAVEPGTPEGQAWPWPIGFGGCTLERRSVAGRTRSSPEAPNLVFVVMDTLRADRTSAYGYARGTTPHLERLAARGLLFEEAYSTSSWTWPSTASLLTGLASEAHGVRSASACHLASELETLAEVLQARGYTTGAFVGNPLIVADKDFDQGFETFSAARGTFLFSEVIGPDVLAWIERNAGTRFFLYAHLVDPHEPYRPLPEHTARFAPDAPEDFPSHALTKYTTALSAAVAAGEPFELPDGHLAHMQGVYDAGVATGDHWLGAILDLVDELDLAGETVVAFTSDHGEEFLDHGLLKHGQSVHAELVRVPLVLAGPGVPVGVRSDVPVSNRHLAPTLARFGGAELARVGDALDLCAPEPRPILFSTHTGWLGAQRNRSLFGWRAEGWVVHFTRDPGADVPRTLGLYEALDVAERTDRAADEGARAARLAGEAAARVEELERGAPAERAAGAATFHVLMGTGYAGDGDEEDD